MKLGVCGGIASIVFVSGITTLAAADRQLNAGDDLQAAIDQAKPGDTILLQAGATFTGNFTLPAKGGDAHITIRSSAPDDLVPGPGVRIDPRDAPRLAKIRATTTGPAIRTAPGSSYWRLLFIEILPGTGSNSPNLVEFGSDGQTELAAVPHHLIVDRCYLHGDATLGQRRGIALNSGSTDIVNSYFADFKSLNESQAIAGWNGPGPYLIENNYLEAAAENVMFGGSDPKIADLVPSQITIRRNLLTKPSSWRPQHWVVKNLFELKNARDVVVEGNIFENHWTAGQQGYAIMLTPRNQEGSAPWSTVRNVVVQNNVIRHVAAAFNILGYDDRNTSQQTENITIRNNLLYDIGSTYGSPSNPAPGRFVLVGGAPKNIRIDHNTVDNSGDATIYIYGGATAAGTDISGFELTNNLLRDNAYGIFGDARGRGTSGLVYCPGAIVSRNVIGGAPAAQYPPRNEYPALSAWLNDFADAERRDYRLKATSRSKSGATDGKDIGVDFSELNAALRATDAASPRSSASSSPPLPQ